MSARSVMGREFEDVYSVHTGALTARVAELEARVKVLEDRQASRHGNATDEAVLEELLPSILAVFGSHSFRVDELPKSFRGALSVKQIGKMFGRNADRPIRGYAVARIAVKRHVGVWVVSKLPDPLPNRPESR